MIITKECDYALRIIRQLSDYEIQSVAVICKNESIPQKFAYKILNKLEKACLVKGVRGRTGGYKLVAELGGITLFDVIQSVGGNIMFNCCINEGVVCPNNSSEKRCLVHREFLRIQKSLEQELGGKSIKEILDK